MEEGRKSLETRLAEMNETRRSRPLSCFPPDWTLSDSRRRLGFQVWGEECVCYPSWNTCPRDRFGDFSPPLYVTSLHVTARDSHVRSASLGKRMRAQDWTPTGKDTRLCIQRPPSGCQRLPVFLNTNLEVVRKQLTTHVEFDSSKFIVSVLISFVFILFKQTTLF